MFERFTNCARQVVVLAQEEARMLNHHYMGTEHLLLGLLREGEGAAAKALEGLGISLEAVRDQVKEIIGQGQQAPTGRVPFTPRALTVLVELALREALRLGHSYIGTAHILLGLIRESEGFAAQVLQELGVELEDVSTAVMPLLRSQLDKGPIRPGSLRSEAPVAAAPRLKIAVPQEWGKAFDELMAHQGEADYDLLLARFLERVARRLRKEAARKG